MSSVVAFSGFQFGLWLLALVNPLFSSASSVASKELELP